LWEKRMCALETLAITLDPDEKLTSLIK
jgi:hypothetical protein